MKILNKKKTGYNRKLIAAVSIGAAVLGGALAGAGAAKYKNQKDKDKEKSDNKDILNSLYEELDCDYDYDDD